MHDVVYAATQPVTAHVPLMTLASLRKSFGPVQALKGVDVLIMPGEVHAIVGENGAGKSTLIGIAAGVLPADAGAIYYDGKYVEAPDPRRMREDGVSAVYQHPALAPDLTVLENLDIGRQPPRHFPDGRPAPSWTPEKLFAIFPNLGRMTDRLGAHMSGGEQQMLTVARTLMGNPLLVALDEPSEGVAPVIVEEMAETIIKLKKQGLSVLLSEQNIHFAELVSDRAYVLEHGRIIMSGPAASLANNARVRQAYLGSEIAM